MSASGSLKTFRTNNFDLIRLAAATQVVLRHAAHDLLPVLPAFFAGLIEWFPGVPVFFFTSGFLISRSYERNSALAEYARNRALRIYPALIACTLAALLAVYATGYLSGASPGSVLLLALSQVTIFQFHNPDFMRGFGTGVLNGSLWTITVELQFYLLVPLLYRLLPRKTRAANLALCAWILVFLAVNRAFYGLLPAHGEAVWHKLWRVSFAPWFYMFLVGVLFQKNHERLHRALAGRFWIAAAAYGLALFGAPWLGWQLGNAVHPVLFAFLCLLVYTAAYSAPRVGHALLRGNDVSYGVYIYHVPVINVLLYYGLKDRTVWFLAALVCTYGLAAASWILVEKPFLRRKRHALNPVGSVTP